MVDSKLLLFFSLINKNLLLLSEAPVHFHHILIPPETEYRQQRHCQHHMTFYIKCSLKDLLFKLRFQKNSSRIPDIRRQDSHTLSGPGWIFKSKMKCQIRFSWTAVLPQELQFPPYGFSGFHIFFQIPEVRQRSYRL